MIANYHILRSIFSAIKLRGTPAVAGEEFSFVVFVASFHVCSQAINELCVCVYVMCMFLRNIICSAPRCCLFKCVECVESLCVYVRKKKKETLACLLRPPRMAHTQFINSR